MQLELLPLSLALSSPTGCLRIAGAQLPSPGLDPRGAPLHLGLLACLQ